MNNNRKPKNNNNNNRNNNRKRILKQNQQQLAVPKPMSLLGETANRAIDILIDVYAINSLGVNFYSFSTGTSIPVITYNLTDSMILQFTEYSQLADLYGLSKLKKIQLGFTRASNLIGSNSADLINTPSFFLQASTIPYTSGTVSLQRAIAQTDNSVEVDLQTFAPKAWSVILPPSIVSFNRANQQTFTFGSETWVSTKLNNTQYYPDLFLNLGALATPTFATGSPSAAFLVGQIHGRMQLSFACPIVN
jgi:hypothetical protein